MNNRWAYAAPGDFASDFDVLNDALTLEYLEAAFYQQGNRAGLLSGVEEQYSPGFQSDEEFHAKALTDTIVKLGGLSRRRGSTSVARSRRRSAASSRIEGFQT